MSDIDERRLREFAAKETHARETLDALGEAIDELKTAEERAPRGVEEDIKSARYELAEISQQLNEAVPEYITKAAGAKHQLMTEGQKRYENRDHKG